MPSTAINEWLHGAARPVKTIVFADLVESVRLMEEHEEQTIRRWLQLVARIERELLPVHEGRLVKSTGDGVMLEFASARPAVQASFALQAMVREENALFTDAEPIAMRVGAHTTPVVAGAHDMYGKGVNLAARLMTLAGPHEIVVSQEVRDALTAELDADIEDLGACFLKHVAEPVRAFRASQVHPDAGGATRTLSVERREKDLRTAIAVMPFVVRSADSEHAVLGEVVAEELILSLSRVEELGVLSRLSTFAYLGRNFSAAQVSKTLSAAYMVTGSLREAAGYATVFAELAETTEGTVLWADSVRFPTRDFLHGDMAVIDKLSSAICDATVRAELRKSQSIPLPNLHSSTLMMGAIGSMHRATPADFSRARLILEHLSDRHPRSAKPFAWRAKWHVLRAVQGWTERPEDEASAALLVADAAIRLDPFSSLPHTMRGLVHAYLRSEFASAEASYQEALRLNPSDSLAWLLVAAMHAFVGKGLDATRAAERALQLSPIDPMRYFYDSLAASAALTAENYERALQLATQSLRANRLHASTLRVLAIARIELGDTTGARSAIGELLAIDPSYSATVFLARHPGRVAAPDFVNRLAASLIRAGLPSR